MRRFVVPEVTPNLGLSRCVGNPGICSARTAHTPPRHGDIDDRAQQQEQAESKCPSFHDTILSRRTRRLRHQAEAQARLAGTSRRLACASAWSDAFHASDERTPDYRAMPSDKPGTNSAPAWISALDD